VVNVPVHQEYKITFLRDGVEVAVLDFSGERTEFTGDMDDAARILLDYVALEFAARLKAERAPLEAQCEKLAVELHLTRQVCAEYDLEKVADMMTIWRQ